MPKWTLDNALAYPYKHHVVDARDNVLWKMTVKEKKMKPETEAFLRPIALWMLTRLGINPKIIYSLKNYPRFRRERKEWLKQGGIITHNFMILDNYEDSAGVAKGQYFHQDLLVARLIHEHNPKRHIDVGSRIDGFVAHVASFRKIEIVDIRPLEKSVHENIKFIQADMMNPHDLGKTDSLSCLHAIEHFGMGRYSDPVDVEGHNKAISNFVNLVSDGGRLYISFPIGQQDEVHFNAHRVFHPETILDHPDIKNHMELIRFDYVDDQRDLHCDTRIDDVDERTKHGCGIYTFLKTGDSMQG